MLTIESVIKLERLASYTSRPKRQRERFDEKVKKYVRDKTELQSWIDEHYSSFDFFVKIVDNFVVFSTKSVTNRQGRAATMEETASWKRGEIPLWDTVIIITVRLS